MPVLASLCLTKHVKEKEPWLARLAHQVYGPVLAAALRLRWLMLGGAVVLLVGEIYVRMTPYANGFLEDEIERLGGEAWVTPLRQEIARVIVGQTHLIDRLLVGLVTNGHILLEGVPGLAKTLSLKTLAAAVQLRFWRWLGAEGLATATDLALFRGHFRCARAALVRHERLQAAVELASSPFLFASSAEVIFPPVVAAGTRTTS
jgi:hypothetical protein